MKTDASGHTNMVVKIIGGKQPSATLSSDRYWEIVVELIFRGAEQFEAYEAAKWPYRAEVGTEREVKPNILMKVKKK